MRRLTSLFRPASRSFRPQGRAGGDMSGMRITLQRLGTPPEGTGAEGAAATGSWSRGGTETPPRTNPQSAPPTIRRAAADRAAGSSPGTPPRLRARGNARNRSRRGHRALSRRRERSRVPAQRAPRAAALDVPPGRVSGGGRRTSRRRPKVQPRPAAERRVQAPARNARVVPRRARNVILLPRLRHAPRRVARGALPARPRRCPRGRGRRTTRRRRRRPFAVSSACFARTAAGTTRTRALAAGDAVYDQQGFEATNGYPNGFWGWGGGQRAVLRCARAGRRRCVRGCPVDDLEGLATVAEKLAADAAGARVRREGEETAFTGKRQVVANGRANGRDVRVFSTGANGEYDGARVGGKRGEDENEKRKTPVRRFAFRARARDRRRGGVRRVRRAQGPSGFASHQHKRAMFYAARARKTGSVDRVSGRRTATRSRRDHFGASNDQRQCHGRKGGEPRRDARPIAPIRPILGARCSENTYEHRFSRNSISHHGSPVHGDVEAFVEAAPRSVRLGVWRASRSTRERRRFGGASRAQRRGRDADDVRALRRARASRSGTRLFEHLGRRRAACGTGR